MVTAQSVEEQLKRIGYYTRTFNRAETLELPSILLDDEEILECVNGWYEGGFALLCATNIRILLVDKKPLKYLTVEDLRFDTINQIDYTHRMLDARINVSAGTKNLKFRSYNQARLRKLIGHVQHRMAEIKKEQSNHTEKQQEHLKQIDQQLQTYLFAQYQQHESMRHQLTPEVLASQITADLNKKAAALEEPAQVQDSSWQNRFNIGGKTPVAVQHESYLRNNGVSSDELYSDGVKEVFGARQQQVPQPQPDVAVGQYYGEQPAATVSPAPSPLRIAYSRIPQMLLNRRVGRASLQQSDVNHPDYTPIPS
jgi:Bacterial PH domain